MPVKTRAAIAFQPHQPLRICELDLADPGPGQVMVKLEATGLCHTDLLYIEGQIPHRFPLILGHEAVGRVIALGPGVEDFAIGDHVIPFSVPHCGKCAPCLSGRTNLCVEMAKRSNSGRTPFSLNGEPINYFIEIGTFAETTVVATDQLVKIPQGARPDHVCCIGCGITTGLGSVLLQAKVGRGASVAVIGAGGVGLGAIQGARIAGASKIICIDANPDKEGPARASGATDFINARTADAVSEVMALTGGGADFVFECVGSAKLIQQALQMSNPAWGVAMCVGIASEPVPVSALSFLNGRSLTGTMLGNATINDVARFVEYYMKGDVKLDDVVTHRFRLDQINEAIDLMRAGQTVRSVIVYD